MPPHADPPVSQQTDERSPEAQETHAVVAGDDALLTAACQLHEVALAAQAQSRYAEAATLAQQALALVEQAVGPDHPDAANVLNALASALEAVGDYATAEH